MKNIFYKLPRFFLATVLALFLFTLLFVISISLLKEYKINTISELVYLNHSTSKNATLKIFQRGGDSIVSLTTPMEVVCYNNGSITKTRHYVKMGHIYKNGNSEGINVAWNDEENGGIVSFGSRRPISFVCN